jgi:Beta-propeller repeat
MKKHLCVVLILLTMSKLYAQNVTILPTGITPAPSGAAYPRISYDAILALPSPVKGDMAYDNTFDCLRIYTGSKWVCTYQKPKDPPNITALSTAGGTSDDYATDVAVDATGAVYITGAFSGSISFGSVIKTSNGQQDIFLAKYSGDGTLLWAVSYGGFGNDGGNALTINSSGNVVVTGYFEGNVTFGLIPASSAGAFDVFVLTCGNLSGAVSSVFTVSGTQSEAVQDVAIDGAGSIFITGSFSGTVNFGGISKTSINSNPDAYVAKYNSAGAAQWVATGGGTSSDIAEKIAIDNTGSPIITGRYFGTTTFGAISYTALGIDDIFVAKYNSSGVLQWLQSAGSFNSDKVYDITTDTAGAIYLTGSYSGTAIFGSLLKTSQGSSTDIYLAKYDNGGIPQWLQSAGSFSNDEARGIAIDASGFVYVTGYFFGGTLFGNINLSSAGNEDMFIAKYNPTTSTWEWVISAGGAATDYPFALARSPSGILYVTGFFNNTINIGPVSKTSAGGKDIFIAKIDK